MGQHADFMKGTASTLRTLVDEGAQHYDQAADAAAEREDRDARQDARDAAALAAKYPALGRR